jgi:hypothetical protein
MRLPFQRKIIRNLVSDLLGREIVFEFGEIKPLWMSARRSRVRKTKT